MRTFDAHAHTLFYQPQLDLLSRTRVGDEALLRALGPDRRLHGPQRTLSRAHAAGELEAVARWTLDVATAQAAALAAAGWRTPIAVNLSPGQLFPELPDMLHALLDARSLPRSALVIELTEDQPLDDAAAHVLVALSEAGQPLALDDLGHAFANLDRVVLPVRWSQLKLDRALVRRACDGHAAAGAVVRAVAGLGRELGALVIAEGLESPRDVAMTLTLGVTVGQGYGLGAPVPGAVLAEDALLDGPTDRG
jgi:EAL domain-containing protein (putative c-di-GMP-specific phosphodiesterase class I)